MDVLTLSRILLRRWYVLLPVLAVTAAGTFLMYQSSSPVYSTTGSLLLADPVLQSTDDREGEPATGSDVASPRIIALVMQDADVQQRILDAGGEADYSVNVGEAGTLLVSARSASQASAVRTVEVLFDEIRREMDQRQDEAEVGDDERLTASILSTPGTATAIEAETGEEASYEARGTLQVLGNLGQENPYSSTGFTFNVLNEVTMAEQQNRLLMEDGEQGSFAMSMDRAPIIRLTVSATDPDELMTLYADTSERLATELEARQSSIGVPAGDRIRLRELTAPGPVVQQADGLVRPLVTVAGLGLVIAMGVTLLAENVATALARQRRDSGRPSNDDPGVGPPDPEVTLDDHSWWQAPVPGSTTLRERDGS